MSASPAHRGEKWSGVDFGAAMACAVRERAELIAERTHRGAPVLDFNAWWRGGDDANARLFLETGSVHDVKTGETLNARDFARTALGLTLPEMMAQFGPTSGRAALPQRAVPAAKPRRTFDAAGAWEALAERAYGPQASSDDEESHAAPDDAAAFLIGRGFPANVRELAESGFAVLDAGMVESLRGVVARDWLEAHVGAALVTPMRSAATNRVEALDLRAFKPRDRDDKRRGPGSHVDDDGAPRGYGLAGAALRAELLVLCEGSADTLAAEMMLRSDPSAVVVGAHGAKDLETWATWLVAQRFNGRVVVVRHLDGKTIGDVGPGQLHAKAAGTILCAARACSAARFRWGALGRALAAQGLNIKPHIAQGFDLADVVALAARAALPWTTLSSTFSDTLRASHDAV